MRCESVSFRSVFVDAGASFGINVLRSGLRLLWQAVRVALLGILMLLEPVISCLLSLAMTLGIVVTVIFEFSAAGPKFPFLGMLAASVLCGVVLLLYYGIVALLVR